MRQNICTAVSFIYADVTHWWGRRGTAWERYTMYTLRQDVAKNLGVPIVPDVKTVLRKGSVGQSVYLLQEKLNALGYDCGNPDGIFGAKTRDSVIAYQKDKKLAADGIVGPATWNELLNDTVDDYDDGSDQDAQKEVMYTVIINHLLKEDADMIAAQYGNATITEE